jgi:hypothetical protein
MYQLSLFAVWLLLGMLPISLCGQKKERPFHLSFEVGSSAYTFMDGRGMHIDHRWWDIFRQKPPIPLLTATVGYKEHSIAISYDEFQHCYICQHNEDGIGPFSFETEANREFLIGFLQWRSFKAVSLTYGYDIISGTNFSLTPRIGLHRRRSLSDSGGEYYIEKIVPHIGYPEGFYRAIYNKVHYDHLTPTLQLFARYTLFNHLTLSIKADYSRFGDGPKNQLGVGALIGYRW